MGTTAHEGPRRLPCHSIHALDGCRDVFDARRRTDPADTVRGRFFLLLDEDDPVLIGEIVYTVAFLTQAHEYVRTAHLREDAEQLLNHLAEDAPDG